MTKATTADNYTALQWVVDELKLEVGQALRSLEEFVEKEDSDEAQLDQCIQHLNQIAGIFSVTGVPLPSLLCSELQALASKYKEISNVSSDECLGVLAESILALGVFLSNPTPNSPRLTAQVNNVRALLDKELLTESSVFEPNLDAGMRAFQSRTDQPLDSKTLRKLRMLFQRSVLDLIKTGVSGDALPGMQKVFKVLYQMGGTAYLSALGYSCSALADRLSSNLLAFGPAVNSCFKRIDEVLRKLIAGENYEDTGLLKNVLFYVAIGSDHSGTSEKVVKAFVLNSYSSDNIDDNDFSTTTSGLEPELVSRVVEALQTEVEQAKTWLDDCLHQTCDFKEAIENVEAILKRIDDTLVMVNTGDPRTTTRQLLNIVVSWRDHADETEINPDDLDQFATSVVNLENSLLSLSDTGDNPERAGYGNAATTIIRESRSSLTLVKDSISQFIEGGMNWEALNDVPANLAMVEGALRFYPLEDLGNVVNCTRRYIRESLLSEKREPDQTEIDLFADVVVAIDYYLECLERGTAFNLDFLIERASDNCARLGFPVEGLDSVAEETDSPAGQAEPSYVDEASEVEAPPSLPVAETAAATSIGIAAGLSSVSEPAAESELEPKIESNIAPEPEVDSTPEPEPDTESNDELDDEIVEIFVEEAQELLPLAKEQLAAWKDGDQSALMDLRRGFHTLKGGGRMIGATAIGELSWSLENLLNRLIDKTVLLHNNIYDVAGEALEAYPNLITALEAGKATEEPAEVETIRKRAFELADPAKPIAEKPPENSELTETFIREAEGLQESIVKHTADLSNDTDQTDILENLMYSVHTLTDCAHNAEFEDIADSLKPMHQVLRHYNSVDEPISNELITLLSIWSGKFSEALMSLKTKGDFDRDALQVLGEQFVVLLHKEEKDHAQQSSNLSLIHI